MIEQEVLLDRFKGTLLGCAVGDALGAPLEGMEGDTIRSRLGEIDDFQDSESGPGRITYGTQMTVVLAQSIAETGRFDLDHTAEKFGRWMEYSDRGLKEARGVDAACEEACRRLYRGATTAESGVDSAGCGSAVRVSPIGLRYHLDLEKLKEAAAAQSTLTHTDPRAHAGAVIVARAVAEGLRNNHGFNPVQFIESLADTVEDVNEDMYLRVRGLMDYLDRDFGEGIEYTGNGGFVVETVPAALLAFLHHPSDPEGALVAAVNSGGDTDSLGAMAGAISGSFNGMDAMPQRLLDAVEGRSYIEELAFRLYTLAR